MTDTTPPPYQVGSTKEQLRDAKKAFRHVWPYARWGLLAGAGCLSLVHLAELYLEPYPVIKALGSAIEHLGVGFIVSSVAVFFYEWGAEAKKLLTLTNRLADVFENDLRPLLAAAADDAIARGLAVLGPQLSSQQLASLRAICESNRKLVNESTWSGPAFLLFLTESLREMSTTFGKLSNVSKDLHDNPRGVFETSLDLPTPAAAAGQMLSAVLAQLPHGGMYRALSDVDSWHPLKLKQFETAQKRAVVDTGITIQRIFLLPSMADNATGETVTQHARLSAEWNAISETKATNGRYEIRVVDEDTLNQTVSLRPDHRHFGIFLHSKEAVPLCLHVMKEDFSSLTFKLPSDQIIDAYERLWDALKTQTTAEIAEMLLTAEVNALPYGGTYKIVSDFDSWRGGGLSKFHRACLDAMLTRGVRVQRIFVLPQGPYDLEACRELLRSHLSDQETHRHSYLVRLCKVRQARARFGAKWQFGFFEKPGAKIRYMVAEASQPGMGDFYMRSTNDLRRATVFDAFWKAMRELDPTDEKKWFK